MNADTQIRLYAEPHQPGRCQSCRAPLEWYETLLGKKMPMNAGARPTRVGSEPHTPRTIAFFSLADSHWNTCPDREAYGKKKAAAAAAVKAYFSATYDSATGRWQWIILVNDRQHSKEVARSVPTYPTEHDANVAAKAVQQQLQNAAAAK